MNTEITDSIGEMTGGTIEEMTGEIEDGESSKKIIIIK